MSAADLATRAVTDGTGHAVVEPPAAMSAHPHLCALIDRAAAVVRTQPFRLALAHACDSRSIEAARAVQSAGLAEVLLVGSRRRIEAAADAAGLSLDGMTVCDGADDPLASAAAAVALCRDGTAAAVMKGALHTDALLAAAMLRECGLRTRRRVSHVFVMDVASVNRPLLMTDCVVNIAPTLLDKLDIAQNAIDLAQAIGITTPHVAILAAVETINCAMPATLDAAALCKMADRGQIVGGVLDGPLAFDNAMSAASAHHKGILSAVAGRPDVLLVPSLEAGNMLYKQLVYLADAECAGLVLGLQVPMVLTSRSDSVASRLASTALAVLSAVRT